MTADKDSVQAMFRPLRPHILRDFARAKSIMIECCSMEAASVAGFCRRYVQYTAARDNYLTHKKANKARKEKCCRVTCRQPLNLRLCCRSFVLRPWWGRAGATDSRKREVFFLSEVDGEGERTSLSLKANCQLTPCRHETLVWPNSCFSLLMFWLLGHLFEGKVTWEETICFVYNPFSEI